MQEIDPYGEYAERIAKKGLTKSGYPQYDYEGFKQAFEAQAGDNMQNLNQLKAEIRAALQLAIATENEKLEETLLDYREKLAKLEQEYLGNGANNRNISLSSVAGRTAGAANGRSLGAQTLIDTDMLPWEERIKTLDEFPNDIENANLLNKLSSNGDFDWKSILGIDAAESIGGIGEKITSSLKAWVSWLRNIHLEDGLHLLPDGSFDDEGKPLPDGTYVRVVNGKRYFVTREDARYPKIVQEYYDSKGKEGEKTVFYEYDSELQRYIKYENINGVIYKDGKEMSEAKSKYLPTEVGGSRLPYEENVAGIKSVNSTYGINYNIAEDGYGMIIDAADEDISKWQDPSWMTSEKKDQNLDDKYGEVYSQWRVSQGFDDDSAEDYGGHLGVDIVPQANGNNDIHPIFPGKVAIVNTDPAKSNGVCVIVEHNINGHKFYSAYAHLQEGSVDSIKVGDTVDTNTQIGIMGGTPNFSEHLHLAVFTGIPTIGFMGYYDADQETTVPGTPYYTKSNRPAEAANNRIYYDPLKVIQSNGLIICYNINDDNLYK